MTGMFNVPNWHSFNEREPLPAVNTPIYVLLEPIGMMRDECPEPLIVRCIPRHGSYGSEVTLFDEFGNYIDTNGSFTPVFWRST